MEFQAMVDKSAEYLVCGCCEEIVSKDYQKFDNTGTAYCDVCRDELCLPNGVEIRLNWGKRGDQ